MRASASSAAAPVAMAVLRLVAVAVSVAWVCGLVSADGSIVDPDYLWRPLSIGTGTELALGLIATASTVGIGWVLLRSYAGGTMSNSRRALLFPATGVAAYAGLTYGAATAPTIVANIGGGLMLLGAVRRGDGDRGGRPAAKGPTHRPGVTSDSDVVPAGLLNGPAQGLHHEPRTRACARCPK